MKYVSIIILIFSLFVINLSNGIAQRDFITSVSSAISNANASQLSSFSMTKISLKTPEYEGSYSQAQSEIILKSFFSKSKPLSFSIDQQGNVDDKTEFVIGNLKSSGGIYKVYILIKEISGKKYIYQLKFDKE